MRVRIPDTPPSGGSPLRSHWLGFCPRHPSYEIRLSPTDTPCRDSEHFGTFGSPTSPISYDDRPMKCACSSVFEMTGNEADQYANEHLVELKVDAVSWTVRYRCPETGRMWLRDSPYGEVQGSGPPRLRQLDAADNVVNRPSKDPFR